MHKVNKTNELLNLETEGDKLIGDLVDAHAAAKVAEQTCLDVAERYAYEDYTPLKEAFDKLKRCREIVDTLNKRLENL